MSETKTFQPAPVTTERVERFMALMCRFGMDTMLDQVMGAAAPAQALGQRSTGLRAVAAPEEDAGEMSITLDLGGFLRALATGGGLRELAAIVIDVPEAEAGAVPVDAVLAAVGPFGQAWQQLMQTLLSFGISSASPKATA